jgi:hypothetical protein
MKSLLIAAGLGALALILIFVFVAARRRPSPEQEALVMQQLRERALTNDAGEMGITPDGEKPWGVIMETDYPGAAASLVTFADGSTSLYFSTGGGVIGGGEHDNVNRAARAFVAKAAEELEHFQPAADHPLPDEGMVRFYLRTRAELLTAAAKHEDLGEGRHPLSTLFLAGQDVLTPLRVMTEQQNP